MQKIQLQASDQHPLTALHWAHEIPGPGLIILHDIFGMTPFIQNFSQYWHEQGFEVITPALYDRIERGVAIPYTPDGYKQALAMKERARNWDQQILDIDTAKVFLQERGIKDVFVMGCSWGGTLTWLAACRLKGLSGGISYYGTHIYNFRLEAPKIPLLLLFAEHDDLVPLEHVRELEQLHPKVEIILYPGSTHAFRCEDWAGGNHQAYDQHTSKLADQRALAFLKPLI